MSVRNLRITFWGVQGSCPIFPAADEVNDYARRVARFTLERALLDLAQQSESKSLSADSIRQLADPDALAAYQRKLGLPDLPTYGGDTTCIEVETAEGNTLVFDMGTGLRDFSRRAVSQWPAGRERTIHLFASHEHLDHRAGLPFAAFCFERQSPFTIHVYGTGQFLRALDERYGLYSHRITPAMHVDDPLDYRMIAGVFTGTEIRDPAADAYRPPAPPWRVGDIGQPIRVGSTRVTAFDVYHGITRCLAYKVSHGGSSFVFCTDHELRHGDDPADPRQIRSLEAERTLMDQCRGVDAAYFDGQYLRSEYDGLEGIGSGPPVSRLDWGHSAIEDVVARARLCGIARTFIGHHDPDRQWRQRIELDQRLREASRGTPNHIELAKAGAVVEI